jgi:hypothetical protein
VAVSESTTTAVVSMAVAAEDIVLGVEGAVDAVSAAWSIIVIAAANKSEIILIRMKG